MQDIPKKQMCGKSTASHGSMLLVMKYWSNLFSRAVRLLDLSLQVERGRVTVPGEIFGPVSLSLHAYSLNSISM